MLIPVLCIPQPLKTWKDYIKNSKIKLSMFADSDFISSARRVHLRYLSDSSPGIRRLRVGRGFKYIDPNGVTICNQNTLERIKNLAIPPAWKDVWISPLDSGHLQATGFDKKGRKQYIYHEDWVKLSNEDKFNKLVDFANLLPEIRNRIQKDLKAKKLTREKILSTIIWLLEHTLIRIGNDEYARENNSFGLTTLRNKHVSVLGSKLKFEFKGKSGVKHLVHISHPTVAKTIKSCIELPGYELFQCIDSDGKRHIIDSQDVNDFLKKITGEQISAKEFRTWGATVLAATNLNDLGNSDNPKEEELNVRITTKKVASRLRNTPKVCRSYYIHPTVTKTYYRRILVPHFKTKVSKKINLLSLNEYKVLTLLQKYS